MTDRRGFTMFELAIVLTIGVILVPLVWAWLVQEEDQARLAAWELEIARALPTVSEELMADARLGVAMDGPSVAFRRAACEVTYEVQGGSLIRTAGEACGGTRALATRVESFAPVRDGVELTFARPLRPARTARRTVFLPWAGR